MASPTGASATLFTLPPIPSPDFQVPAAKRSAELYNASLLEDIEEETPPNSLDAREPGGGNLAKVEEPNGGFEDPSDGDGEKQASPDNVRADELLAGDESESWSDDPVRMYLTQMGEIPLLTRKQEISLAREIEITRAQFRRKLLECDLFLRSAVKDLVRVHTGDLPFDRTVQVSVTDRLEKE